jgi:hypothetical protein
MVATAVSPKAEDTGPGSTSTTATPNGATS